MKQTPGFIWMNLMMLLNCLAANAQISLKEGVYRVNDCLEWIHDTNGRSHKTFKAVNVTVFRLDSAMQNKKMIHKDRITFDKAGHQLLMVSKDTTDQIIDSTRWKYDENLVSRFEYSCDNSSHKMELSSIETFTYSDIGNIVKDTTWNKIYNSSCLYYDIQGNQIIEREYSIANSKSKMKLVEDHEWAYNAKGKVVKDSFAHKLDNIYNSQYNPKGKKNKNPGWEINYTQKEYDAAGNNIYTYENYNGYESRDYRTYNGGNKLMSIKGSGDVKMSFLENNTYDSAGNEIECVFIVPSANNPLRLDTLITKIIYDKKSRKVEERKIDHEGIWTYKWSYKPDNTYEYTVSVYRYTDGGKSLVKSEMDYMRFNKDSTKTADMDSSWYNGNLTIDVHKYQFNNSGKMLFDSVITTEMSGTNSSTSIGVYSYRYDARGNKIEETNNESGDLSRLSYKKVWAYNENDSLLEYLYYEENNTKPDDGVIKEFYPDGKTLKKITTLNRNLIKIERYSNDSRIVESVETRMHNGNDENNGTEQSIFEYEDW